MKKHFWILQLTVMFSLFLVIIPVSKAVVVEFGEVDLPNLTLLDGTTHFDPFGISFADETFYAIDSRFTGDDDVGITTTGGSNNIMTVIFMNGASEVTFYWMHVDDGTIFADAFDSNGTVIASFSDTGGDGIHTFNGVGTISKITWHNGNGRIGVGRIEYMPTGLSVTIDITAVPNPATVGGPLDIRLDLENTGTGFDSDFRLYVLAGGDIIELLNISPFVSSGLVITGLTIFSGIVPPGAPIVVGFLAVIYDAPSGGFLAFDMEIVGIGVIPSAADIAALRQAATEYLE